MAERDVSGEDVVDAEPVGEVDDGPAHALERHVEWLSGAGGVMFGDGPDPRVVAERRHHGQPDGQERRQRRNQSVGPSGKEAPERDPAPERKFVGDEGSDEEPAEAEEDEHGGLSGAEGTQQTGVGEKDAQPGGPPETVEWRGVPEEAYLGRMLFGLGTGETCAVGSDVLVAKLEFRDVDLEPVLGGGTLLVNERRWRHSSMIPPCPGSCLLYTSDAADAE